MAEKEFTQETSQDVDQKHCCEETADHTDDPCSQEVDKDKTDAVEKNSDEEKKPKRKMGCNNEEILAVLAHELGHWKLSHNLKNLVIGQVSATKYITAHPYFRSFMFITVCLVVQHCYNGDIRFLCEKWKL